MQPGICRAPIFRFGSFGADVARNTLTRNGTLVKIQDQPFRVLIFLLERHGVVVTRDELRQLLWGDETYVDFDASLNVILKKLRAALGDDSDNPRFIETVPRHGYRFIAPVAVGDSGAEAISDSQAAGQRTQSASNKDADAPGTTKAPSASPRIWFRLIERVAVAAVAVFATIVVLKWTRPHSNPGAVVRSYLLAPEKTKFDSSSFAALSPDGYRLAFVANLPNGGPRILWVQALDAASARPLAGTENATLPFWSPDGQHVAFFAGGKLRKVDAEGGPPQTLCDAPLGRGGTWNQYGVILFAPDPSSALQEVAATGGAPKMALLQQSPKAAPQAWWPQFLPDGKRFIYWSGALKSNEVDGIYVAELNSKKRRFLVATESNGLYANGNLLYVHDQTLLAQRFDPDHLNLSGHPARLAEGLGIHGGMHYAEFAASQTGLLAYFAGRANRGWPMVMFDRNGKLEGRIYPQRDLFLYPRFSPDGKQLAVSIGEPGGLDDLWVIDLRRGSRKRITFGSGDDTQPVWSADGKTIYYSCSREPGGTPHICARLASGAGDEESVLETAGVSEIPMDVSHDGRVLTFARRDKGHNTGIWMLPLPQGRKPVPFLQSARFNATDPAFSPEGKWLTYSSDETGNFEIYVARTAGDGKWQVSSGGGTSPAWSPHGKQLYYLDQAENLIKAEVHDDGAALDFGQPVALVQNATFAPSGPIAVAADGRILVNGHNDEESAQPMTLVTNWPTLLKKQP